LLDTEVGPPHGRLRNQSPLRGLDEHQAISDAQPQAGLALGFDLNCRVQ
jgi:hypothetical protein